MARSRCPGCAAPFESDRPDPIARCTWCAALLAPAAIADRLVASPSVSADDARRAIVSAAGAEWRPAGAQLVAYPFAADGSARRPLRPLAALPPLLAGSWRASGAGLAAGHDDSLGDDAVRVAPSATLPEGTSVVLYPFWRVTLRRADEETAAWCDAVDGQVVLPDELTRVERDASSRSTAGAAVVPVAGLVLGAALPLPWSIAPFLLALALVARPPFGATER